MHSPRMLNTPLVPVPPPLPNPNKLGQPCPAHPGSTPPLRPPRSSASFSFFCGEGGHKLRRRPPLPIFMLTVCRQAAWTIPEPQIERRPGSTNGHTHLACEATPPLVLQSPTRSALVCSCPIGPVTLHVCAGGSKVQQSVVDLLPGLQVCLTASLPRGCGLSTMQKGMGGRLLLGRCEEIGR